MIGRQQPRPLQPHPGLLHFVLLSAPFPPMMRTYAETWAVSE